MSGLDNKVALVTGAGRGIGRAIALILARAGVHVAVHHSRSQEGAREVARQAAALGVRSVTIQGDMADVGQVRDVVRLAEDALGGLDILVNNAGVFSTTPVFDVDEALWDRVLDTNLKGPFFCAQAAARGMLERGGGVIINLGSWVARLSLPLGALYASTKAAMETLTRAWSAEFADSGIRVNAVSPGVIRDPALDGPWAADGLMAGTPAGGSGGPDAIAAAVAYLASDEAEFVHGTVLDVDGGRTGVAVVAA